jgi:hypothetical protein
MSGKSLSIDGNFKPASRAQSLAGLEDDDAGALNAARGEVEGIIGVTLGLNCNMGEG